MRNTEAAGPPARERLLAAANELFYREGVRTVGIDRNAEANPWIIPVSGDLASPSRGARPMP
jgi:hypothetical protein